MRILAVASCCALVVSCNAANVRIVRVDARTYDVTAERFGDASREHDRVRVLGDLRHRARKQCKGWDFAVDAPVYEDGFGGYGPIFGEGPLVRVRARVTCP